MRQQQRVNPNLTLAPVALALAIALAFCPNQVRQQRRVHAADRSHQTDRPTAAEPWPCGGCGAQEEEQPILSQEQQCQWPAEVGRKLTGPRGAGARTGLVVSACDARPDVFIVSFSERLMLGLCVSKMRSSRSSCSRSMFFWIFFFILCRTRIAPPTAVPVGRERTDRPVCDCYTLFGHNEGVSACVFNCHVRATVRRVTVGMFLTILSLELTRETDYSRDDH